MNEPGFEELVSQWLDEPTPALRARIDAALALDPGLQAALSRLGALDQMLARHTSLPALDWQRLSAGLCAGVRAAQTDAVLDDLLRASTEPRELVRWDELRARVWDEISERGDFSRRALRLRRGWPAGLAGLAAAAAIALFVVPFRQNAETRGHALATVAVAGPLDSGGFACASVTRISAPAPAFANAPVPELILMISPPERHIP